MKPQLKLTIKDFLQVNKLVKEKTLGRPASILKSPNPRKGDGGKNKARQRKNRRRVNENNR